MTRDAAGQLNRQVYPDGKYHIPICYTERCHFYIRTGDYQGLSGGNP
jgi:hypothetical protein